MKNILILNAGTRNRLIRDFKKSLDGRAKIIATDNYYLAPAIYEADKYYVTKRWDEEGYWDEVFEICDKDQIGLVLSLVDPELELLAHHKTEFENRGILVNIGEEEIVHKCFDKFCVLQYLKEHDYPVIQTYLNYNEAKIAIEKKEVSFPLFVKPRIGSGSIGVEKIENIEQLKVCCEKEEGIIIQEYMSGSEYGVDVYVDMLSKKVVSVFAKRKLKMRAGETDKSVSYKNEKLFALIRNFAEEIGLSGVNDIDVFEQNGEFYISEINPRFGGGYLHAYECGEDFLKYLINNMNGIVNDSQIGNYESGIYMMKFFDIMTMKEEE